MMDRFVVAPSSSRARIRLASLYPLRSGFLLVLALSGVLAGRPASGDDFFLDPIYEVDVTDGIEYAAAPTESGDMSLLLDLYQPVDGLRAPEGRPALVWVHGGGFVSGSRSGPTELAWSTFFAQRGWVVVSISYRLDQVRPVGEPFFDTVELAAELQRLSSLNIIWPPGHFSEEPDGPENLAGLLRAASAAGRDTSSAVRWVRENAEGLGIDADRIVVGGESAGAIASLFSAYLISPVDASAEVAGVLDICGSIYGNEGAITADGPPLLIIHGDADVVVPFSFAEALRARAVSVGLAHRLARVTEWGHCPRITEVSEGLTSGERAAEFFYEELALEELVPPDVFRRGDANIDGAIDVSDALYTLGYLFGRDGGIPIRPNCFDAVDTTDDGAIDVSDSIYGLNYAFFGGAEPPAPGPIVCGADPSDDALDCALYRICEE